jgi:hypothetical protein
LFFFITEATQAARSRLAPVLIGTAKPLHSPTEMSQSPVVDRSGPVYHHIIDNPTVNKIMNRIELASQQQQRLRSENRLEHPVDFVNPSEFVVRGVVLEPSPRVDSTVSHSVSQTSLQQFQNTQSSHSTVQRSDLQKSQSVKAIALLSPPKSVNLKFPLKAVCINIFVD